MILNHGASLTVHSLYHSILHRDAPALGVGRGRTARTIRPTIWDYRDHTNLVRFASSIRTDVIFGKDKSATVVNGRDLFLNATCRILAEQKFYHTCRPRLYVVPSAPLAQLWRWRRTKVLSYRIGSNTARPATPKVARKLLGGSLMPRRLRQQFQRFLCENPFHGKSNILDRTCENTY